MAQQVKTAQQLLLTAHRRNFPPDQERRIFPNLCIRLLSKILVRSPLALAPRGHATAAHRALRLEPLGGRRLAPSDFNSLVARPALDNTSLPQLSPRSAPSFEPFLTPPLSPIISSCRSPPLPAGWIIVWLAVRVPDPAPQILVRGLSYGSRRR